MRRTIRQSLEPYVRWAHNQLKDRGVFGEADAQDPNQLSQQSLEPVHLAPNSQPLRIALEFARAEQSGDPYGFRFAEQDYLLRSEGGSFKTARMVWDDKLLEDLADLRQPNRDPAMIQRVGETLRLFLAPTKWSRDEDKILQAIKERRQVIFTVRSAAAELYALPWELLTLESTGQHIGELPGTVLRYEWPETSTIPQADIKLAPRVMFAWSAAGGSVPAADHLAALRSAYKNNPLTFDENRDVLPHASLSKISRALLSASKQGNPISILHLLCHGGPIGSTFGLLLDDEDGEPVVADAGRLRQIFAPHAKTLRLIVLSACDSGNSGALGNQLGSIAQALHRSGIASVLASRYPLSVSGSSRFTGAFFSTLVRSGGSLERAVMAARLRLAEDASQLDWASLQLYSHSDDQSAAVSRAMLPTLQIARTKTRSLTPQARRAIGAGLVVLTLLVILLLWPCSPGSHQHVRSDPSDEAGPQDKGPTYGSDPSKMGPTGSSGSAGSGQRPASNEPAATSGSPVAPQSGSNSHGGAHSSHRQKKKHHKQRKKH